MVGEIETSTFLFNNRPAKAVRHIQMNNSVCVCPCSCVYVWVCMCRCVCVLMFLCMGPDGQTLEIGTEVDLGISKKVKLGF